MDHPCEQCGASVENGRPFCPKCRTPQLRVELVAASPASLPPPAEPLPELTPEQLAPSNPLASSDPIFFRTALHAGLLGVMANLIPYGLGMVLTGIVATLLYRRNNKERLPARKAARLGAMAGAISFAATSLLIVLGILLLQAQDQLHDFMMKAAEQSIAGRSGPDVQGVIQWLHTPQGFGIFLALGMVMTLALSVLLSALGGAVGAVLFRAPDRQQ